MPLEGVLAVTLPDWLDSLARSGTREVNFWQPSPTRVSFPEGTPWIFKVRGTDRVAGFGFFTYWTVMPVAIAWETFGVANGAADFGTMLRTVERLRRSESGDGNVGCVVLSDVTILPRSEWIVEPQEWKKNTVRMARFDLTRGDVGRVWSRLLELTATTRSLQSPLLSVPGGRVAAMQTARRGQGAFRLMVMDAYERRCAITGERTLPALEAAHIRPFADVPEHDVRNGILMRSDVHRLYDLGLVTVTSQLTFRVSRSIERDYSNGRVYYDLDGSTIRTPPNELQRPDPVALAWHAEEIFRP